MLLRSHWSSVRSLTRCGRVVLRCLTIRLLPVARGRRVRRSRTRCGLPCTCGTCEHKVTSAVMRSVFLMFATSKIANTGTHTHAHTHANTHTHTRTRTHTHTHTHTKRCMTTSNWYCRVNVLVNHVKAGRNPTANEPEMCCCGGIPG